MKMLIWIYRKIFCRKYFYNFNLRIFDLCLRGIGILNYEGYKVSGEDWFFNVFLRDKRIKTVLDVGANTDPYGIGMPEVEVFALEPNKSTFRQLLKNTKSNPNIHCFPFGLSNKKGKAFIYDFDKSGTAHATLDGNVLEKQYGIKPVKSEITLTTLDAFVKEHRIKSLDLLKIDTEGNEYKVLQGAKETLLKGRIRIILFEFNEMNAYNRVFMGDFYDLLKGFTFYRLLPDDLAPLGKYRPITHELFAFQNIVAIKNSEN